MSDGALVPATPPPALATPPPAGQAVTPPLRVVIVDDEPLARLRLRTLVQANPEPRAAVVGEAGDVLQALRLIQAVACDVVLLDIVMPGGSGLKLADDLRRRPRRSPRRWWSSSRRMPSMRCAPSRSTRPTT